MVGHEDWVENQQIAPAIKEAKEVIREALKPNKFPGGSKEDNLGLEKFRHSDVLTYKYFRCSFWFP